MEGKLHIYAPAHVLFEYNSGGKSQSLKTDAPQSSTNLLLFIGGLSDNFETVPYVKDLAHSLSGWTVCHVQLSSSGKGWGMANLDEDVAEIAMAVTYVRQHFKGDLEANVVLIGHSTGCQDVLHYIHSAVPLGQDRSPIQGAILQAPVSDREAVLNQISKNSELKAIYELANQFAQSLEDDEKSDMIIPIPWSQKLWFDRTPLSVARFESLVSPKSPRHPSMDDLFSSDLTDERLKQTFGSLGRSRSFSIVQTSSSSSADQANQHTKPNMLILISGADEHMPESIDKRQLLSRWKTAIEYEGTAVLDQDSRIIEGGKHNLRGRDGERKAARDQMVQVVARYLERVARTTSSCPTPSQTLPHRPSL